MKTRQGFVSNSSSSSFIIIGTKTDFKNISKADISNGIIVVGRTLCDGQDVIRVSDDQMLDFILNHRHQFHTIYKDAKGYYDPQPIKCEDWMIGLDIDAIEADQHSSNSLKDLVKNYP